MSDTFEEWFNSYSANYSKDQWSLRDAWNAARQANQPQASATLRANLDAALFNKHGGGSVSSRWTVDSILDAIMPIITAHQEPQGKAQPESGEMGRRSLVDKAGEVMSDFEKQYPWGGIPCSTHTEIAKPIPGLSAIPPERGEWDEIVEQREREAFQRGQQAGLEKAIAGNPILPVFLDWLGHRLVNLYRENPNVDFVQACHRRANELRSLASAAPPQGEAKKEERATGEETLT